MKQVTRIFGVVILSSLLFSCTSNRSKKNQENLLSVFEETPSSKVSNIEDFAPASEVSESKPLEKNEDLLSELAPAPQEATPVVATKEEPKLEETKMENFESSPVAAVEPISEVKELAPAVEVAKGEAMEPKEAIFEEPKPVKKAGKKAKAKVAREEASLAPEIKQSAPAPKESVWKTGEVLNRYYPLRAGETPEAVSEILFGSKDKAADLKKWNQGEWQVGRVLLYPSPTQTDDLEMKSFEVDQVAVAEAPKVKAPEPEKVIPQAPIQVVEKAPAAAEIPSAEVPVTEEKVKNKKLANPDVGDFIGRYLTFIVAGLLTILGLYFILRKFFGNKAFND